MILKLSDVFTMFFHFKVPLFDILKHQQKIFFIQISIRDRVDLDDGADKRASSARRSKDASVEQLCRRSLNGRLPLQLLLVN